MNAPSFFAGTSDYGAVLLEWTDGDGNTVGFFIEPEDLPKTVATTRNDRTPPVHEVTIPDGETLARLLNEHAVAPGATEA